jgi:hypothetical protein
MDLRKLRAGEWILALSGVALLVSLFLPWYSHAGDITGEGAYFNRSAEGRTNFSAWDLLSVNDVILAVIALAAIAVLVATATQSVPAVPIALEAMVAVLGFVAIVLVAVRLIWLPELAEEREWGLWLALAAASGLTAGAWIGVRDDRMAGSPPPPEIEALPAPRP